ncbi:hypothetical protein [Paucidesulfovibrio longus]|jgi:hypothetical protein|uniref:hypothetical protein n=1 Tax=Paucidesulfovibrio longus TaxID=889 RepID=UPI0003B5FA19|nr:hypothetical protein [Paucidesulfovibrio longus]
MRDDVRSYGDITGISPENYEKIKDSIPYPQVRYADGKLHLDHEGKYIDVEGFLDELVQLMDEDGWGEVDFLDHLGQEMVRYRLRRGGWKAERRPFSAIGTAEMRGL